MNSTKLTIPELEAILQNYRVEIELVPYRGCIDYTGKKITINPAFDMAETLVHETLHHYTEQHGGATEWYVRETAKEMVRDIQVREFAENYVRQYGKKIPSRTIFCMVG